MDREKGGILELLDNLKRGIEYVGWSGGPEFQKYLMAIVGALEIIHTEGTLVPKIEGLTRSEAQEFIQKELGFSPLTDAEWKVFALRLFAYADWHEAMTRTFWEEILPMRVGKESGVNRHYIHTYEHCDCEWEVRWYMAHTAKCPICGADLIPTKSVPVVE